MLRSIGQSFAGAAQATPLYLMASFTAAFLILVSAAALSDVALGFIWVTGAMFGGLLIAVVCAAVALLPHAMPPEPTKAGAVERVERERILRDLAPFTFIVAGPVLRARAGAADLFARKEGYVNVAWRQ